MPELTANQVIPLIFIIIGVVLIFIYFRNRMLVQASQGWPAVQGEVVESWVSRRDSTDSDGDVSSRYYPEIRYRYQVMGHEHLGEKITFGPRYGGARSKAEKVAARYPAGTNVMVYYQPDRPDNAVLERSVPRMLLIYGVIFILVGIFFFFRWG